MRNVLEMTRNRVTIRPAAWAIGPEGYCLTEAIQRLIVPNVRRLRPDTA